MSQAIRNAAEALIEALEQGATLRDVLSCASYDQRASDDTNKAIQDAHSFQLLGGLGLCVTADERRALDELKGQKPIDAFHTPKDKAYLEDYANQHGAGAIATRVMSYNFMISEIHRVAGWTS